MACIAWRPAWRKHACRRSSGSGHRCQESVTLAACCAWRRALSAARPPRRRVQGWVQGPNPRRTGAARVSSRGACRAGRRLPSGAWRPPWRWGAAWGRTPCSGRSARTTPRSTPPAPCRVLASFRQAPLGLQALEEPRVALMGMECNANLVQSMQQQGSLQSGSSDCPSKPQCSGGLQLHAQMV